jgi:hypothetical protein
MRIAMIGTGNVGAALAPAFERAGHEVVYGVRDIADPKHAGASLPVRSTRDAADWAEVVVLAVNWAQVDDALADCGDLDGKILIDCTNPLAFGPDGISLLLGFNTSGGEIIASKTKAKVVKTLNHVGSPVMGNAHAYASRPIQFVCGDDEPARQVVSNLLRDIGFEPIDYGGIENSRKLEPLAMLWIDQAHKYGMKLTNALTFIGPDH